MDESIVLFVHGSFFSAWCWIPVIERLEKAGVRCATIELPFMSLESDVLRLRESIAALVPDNAVTVVCHSYTGITLSMAGHDAHHLVYVAARLPAVGESQAELSSNWGNPDFRSCIVVSEDGSIALSNDAKNFLFNRSPVALAQLAMNFRRSMRSEIPSVPIHNPAWLSVPSSYIVCTDDKTVRLDQQRQRASWVANSLEIDCDHSPFFSAPDETATFIASHRAMNRLVG